MVFAGYGSDFISSVIKPSIYLFNSIIFGLLTYWSSPLVCNPNKFWIYSTESLDETCLSSPLQPRMQNGSDDLTMEPIRFYRTLPITLFLNAVFQYLPYLIWTGLILGNFDLRKMISGAGDENVRKRARQMEELHCFLRRSSRKNTLKIGYLVYKLLQLAVTSVELYHLSEFLAAGDYWKLLEILNVPRMYIRIMNGYFPHFPPDVSCNLPHLNRENKPIGGPHSCYFRLSSNYELFFNFMWVFSVVQVVIIVVGIYSTLTYNYQDLVDWTLDILKRAGLPEDLKDRALYLLEFEDHAYEFRKFLGPDGYLILDLVNFNWFQYTTKEFCGLLFKFHVKREKRHRRFKNIARVLQ